jgi:manganese/iron transport system permease protein
MAEVLDALFSAYSLPFMRWPLIALVLLGVTCGILGVLVTLRSLEYLSDGLVHAVFPGIVIGFAVAARPGLLVGAAIAAVVAAVALTLAARRVVGSDAAIAVVLVSMFSIGVIVVSRQSDYAGQLEELLFGRLLTVQAADVTATAILCGVALLLVLPTYKEQLFRAFDARASEAAGYRGVALDLALNVAVALVIVAAANAIGNLLALALLIVPGAIAKLLARRLGLLVPIAVAAAVLAGWLGLSAGYAASVHHGIPLPGGATVVALLVLGYLALVVATRGVPALLRSRRES